MALGTKYCSRIELCLRFSNNLGPAIPVPSIASSYRFCHAKGTSFSLYKELGCRRD